MYLYTHKNNNDIGFEENIYFAKNWSQSAKIVIINNISQS
jgi:hypothetical protein